MVLVYDEVEARPENDGEASDIGDPADFADDENEDDGGFVFEGFEDVACCLQDYADGCDDDGPEVDSGVAFERDVDKDEEFNAHPVGESTEGSDKTVGCWTVLLLELRCLKGIGIWRLTSKVASLFERMSSHTQRMG